MNRGDRCFVVLFAPTKFPTRAADSPRAKADRSDGQVGVTEPLRFHIKSSFHRDAISAFNLPSAAAIRATALCRAIDFRLRLAGWRFDNSPPRHASSVQKCRRLDRCNSPAEQVAPG